MVGARNGVFMVPVAQNKVLVGAGCSKRGVHGAGGSNPGVGDGSDLKRGVAGGWGLETKCWWWWWLKTRRWGAGGCCSHDTCAGGSNWGAGGPGGLNRMAGVRNVETGVGCRKRMVVSRNGCRWVKNRCWWLNGVLWVETRGWVSKTDVGVARHVAGGQKEVMVA